MNEPAAIGTIVLIVLTGGTSFQGFRNPAFQARLIFDPTAVLRDKQYYRLMTSGFLHADWIHFGFNAFSFYAFGRHIEMFFGVFTLLAIYLGSIVGGGLLSLYLHRHHEYRALGASGGVCGVIFASIFLLPGGGVVVFPFPFSIPSWLYAILFIVGSFAAMKRQRDNIGHDAHLGGAVVGLLITTALYPSIVRESPVLYAAVLALAALLFGYVWVNPLLLPTLSVTSICREFFSKIRGSRRQRERRRDERDIDGILGKISKSGLDSLTPSERRALDSFSKQRRRGEPR